MDPVHALSCRARLGLALLVLQGCLSYHESVDLKSDGSGLIRIAYGLKPDSATAEQAKQLQQSIQNQPGLSWASTLDSSSSDRHWYGGILRFHSLGALNSLNELLPSKSLFENLEVNRSATEGEMRRSILLPTNKEKGPRDFKIAWRVPGRILAADSHAIWEKGTNIVRWSFPTDGSVDTWAHLSVRWKQEPPPALPEPTAIPTEVERVPALPKLLFWGLLGAAVMVLVAALASVRELNKLRSALRARHPSV